jgi:ribosomal-protein-alanine N-acetyltransferase
MSVSREARLAFRQLAEHHLEAVLMIEPEAYPEPWTIGMFREEIRSPRSHFYVAMKGHKLIGYCGFWLVLDEAHITSITVERAHRGQGFGREQLLFLLGIGEELGVRTYTLEVRESNAPARNLYRSLGFEEVGRRTGYYSSTQEDAIVMVKRVDF